MQKSQLGFSNAGFLKLRSGFHVTTNLRFAVSQHEFDLAAVKNQKLIPGSNL